MMFSWGGCLLFWYFALELLFCKTLLFISFFVLRSRSFSASSILLSNLCIFLHQLLHFLHQTVLSHSRACSQLPSILDLISFFMIFHIVSNHTCEDLITGINASNWACLNLLFLVTEWFVPLSATLVFHQVAPSID